MRVYLGRGNEVMKYQIICTLPNGERSVVAGCGRNKGTWDTTHTRRTAQRHARGLRELAQDSAHRFHNCTFTVEEV
jgi:hypothetical protein